MHAGGVRRQDHTHRVATWKEAKGATVHFPPTGIEHVEIGETGEAHQHRFHRGKDTRDLIHVAADHHPGQAGRSGDGFDELLRRLWEVVV